MQKANFRFRFRSLILLTLAAAIFFAGYRAGYDQGRNDRFDDLLDLIKVTVAPGQWEQIVESSTAPGDATSVATTETESLDPFASVDENSFADGDPFR